MEFRDQHVNWVMNASKDVLENRMEVQFFDKFDLLGHGVYTKKEPKRGSIFYLLSFSYRCYYDLYIIYLIFFKCIQ